MGESARRRLGAYYTPAWLVRQALAAVPEIPRSVLDLACGDGAWLREAGRRWPEARLIGIDLDPLAIRAAKAPGVELRVGDGLALGEPADLIVGNPPWGIGRAPKVRRGPESAAAFLARSLELGARVCLILPLALFEVRAHRAVREALLQRMTVERVEPLGDPFPGVFAPAALLVARRGPDPEPDRVLHPWLSAEDRALLSRLEAGGERLQGRATFILGVVTGGNARALGSEGEPIVTGRDVAPFAIRAPARRLSVPLSDVQQAAPRAAYARPKVVYRFIGAHPVAAVDEGGRLTLNSANALAPDDPALDPHYVAALLNSSPLRFAHRARTSLPRVLRSQLERLPLPAASPAERRSIAELARAATSAHAQKILDDKVIDLYRLRESERRHLERACRRS